MNILVLAHEIGKEYGVSPFVYQQAEALVALGHRVELFMMCPFGKKHSEPSSASLSLPLRRVYFLSASRYGKYGFNSYTCAVAIDKMLPKHCPDFCPDVVLAHTIGGSGAAAVRLKKKYGWPVIIVTHGSDTTLEIQNGKREYIAKICRQADVVAAVSSKLQRELLRVNSSIPVQVLHNGYNIEGGIQKTPKRKDSLVVAGNLVPSKHVEQVIEAVADLITEFPNLSLDIVGDGPEWKALTQQVADRGMNNCVHFYGHVPHAQLTAHMAAGEIFCLPSHPEGLGVVYLEAMACGCAVIGTEGEGIEDIIRHGENGLLVPPDHVDKLKKTIRILLQGHDYRKKLAQAGQITVENLTWDKNAKKLTSIFYKIVES